MPLKTRLMRRCVKTTTLCFVTQKFPGHVVLLWLPLSSGVRFAMVISCYLFFVFSFLSSLFSHCVLYHQSSTPSFAVALHSPPTLSKSLFSLNAMLPSHFRSSSPPFPSTFWASAPFASFSTPILSTRPARFSPLLTSVFLKFPSLQPPISVRPFLSHPLSSLSRFFSSSCFHKPALSSPSSLSHTCMPG